MRVVRRSWQRLSEIEGERFLLGGKLEQKLPVPVLVRYRIQSSLSLQTIRTHQGAVSSPAKFLWFCVMSGHRSLTPPHQWIWIYWIFSMTMAVFITKFKQMHRILDMCYLLQTNLSPEGSHFDKLSENLLRKKGHLHLWLLNKNEWNRNRKKEYNSKLSGNLLAFFRFFLLF